MAVKKRLQPMLAFMLILPRFFGGQIMVWWSTVLSQISAAALAVFFAAKTQKSSYATGEFINAFAKKYILSVEF